MFPVQERSNATDELKENSAPQVNSPSKGSLQGRQITKQDRREPTLGHSPGVRTSGVARKRLRQRAASTDSLEVKRFREADEVKVLTVKVSALETQIANLSRVVSSLVPQSNSSDTSSPLSSRTATPSTSSQDSLSSEFLSGIENTITSSHEPKSSPILTTMMDTYSASQLLHVSNRASPGSEEEMMSDGDSVVEESFFLEDSFLSDSFEGMGSSISQQYPFTKTLIGTAMRVQQQRDALEKASLVQEQEFRKMIEIDYRELEAQREAASEYQLAESEDLNALVEIGEVVQEEAAREQEFRELIEIDQRAIDAQKEAASEYQLAESEDLKTLVEIGEVVQEEAAREQEFLELYESDQREMAFNRELENLHIEELNILRQNYEAVRMEANRSYEPKDPVILRNLGRVLLSLGCYATELALKREHFQEARRHLTDAFDFEPENPAILGDLGTVLVFLAELEVMIPTSIDLLNEAQVRLQRSLEVQYDETLNRNLRIATAMLNEKSALL